MHVLSVPCLIMTAINFYVALYYFFLFVKRPQAKEHLAFAVLCFSMALYDVFCVGLYNSLSFSKGVFWQKLQFYMIDIIAISMIWFALAFTKHKKSRISSFFMAAPLVLMSMAIFATPEYFISTVKASVKHVDFMNVLKIDYYEGELGLICNVELLFAVVIFIYSLCIFVGYYNKTKDRSVFIVVAGFFIYFFGLINDILVAMRVNPFIYISEYAFFVIVLAMGYVLLNKFANLQTAFEELNISLEKKVEERTAENENITAKLFQSEKMSAVGQLTSGLAHEINNPIGVILGFSQGIIKRVKEDSPLYMPLKSMEREAVRCKNLVNELLLFSSTGKTHSEKIQINALIEETIEFVGARAKDGRVEIEKKYNDNLPELTMNKNQIQQVIVNICNDAFDAMPDGGKLIIATRRVENRVEIEITDSGTGMTEDVKKHIFEPFFTTKEAGKGTGLGLSLCYEIIQKHNGSIEVISELNKGTSFIIKLPVDQNRDQQ